MLIERNGLRKGVSVLSFTFIELISVVAPQYMGKFLDNSAHLYTMKIFEYHML